VQGTTRRGPGPDPFDLGIFSDASPAASVAGAWERLRVGSGCRTVVLARQVHGTAVRAHGPGIPGLHLAEACDGHVTATPGVLLAVTVADCVPVFLVDPDRRAVALLHSGWRGAAQGIMERGVQALRDRMGSAPAALRAHLGPCICGSCYEVGPEVFTALGLLAPPGPAPLDLRSVLAARAVAAGLDAARVTVSEHCTLCGDAGLFSHRRGERARQAGYLGIQA
jgi:YfiH family protein